MRQSVITAVNQEMFDHNIWQQPRKSRAAKKSRQLKFKESRER